MGEEVVNGGSSDGTVDFSLLVMEGANVVKILLFWTLVASPAVMIRIALNPPPPLGFVVSGWIALAYIVGGATLLLYLIARGIELGQNDGIFS